MLWLGATAAAAQDKSGVVRLESAAEVDAVLASSSPLLLAFLPLHCGISTNARLHARPCRRHAHRSAMARA